MSRTWWVHRLFGRRPSSIARPVARPGLTRLEDRTTPTVAMTVAVNTATVTGDGASDLLQIDATGGLLRHNRFTAGDPGFASDFDFDSTAVGDQTLAANALSSVVISMGAGDDTLRLVGGAADLNAAIDVNNLGANAGDRIEIDDSGRLTTATYTYSTAGVSFTGPGYNVTLSAFHKGGFFLTSGQSTDTVNVEGTFGLQQPVFLNSAGSPDTVNVTGSTAGSLVGLGSDVIVRNSPSASVVNINNTTDAAARTATLDTATLAQFPGQTFGRLTTSASVGKVYYAMLATQDVSDVNIAFGTGATSLLVDQSVAATDGGFNTSVTFGDAVDTVSIAQTSKFVNYSFNTGGGLDVVTAGSTGSLTKLAGPVTVDGQADGVTLIVDGSAAAVAADYAVSATTVTRSLPAGFGGVTYANAASLLLTVGAGANVVDVTGTAAGTPTTVNTNAGIDTVNVLSTNATGPLTVNTGSELDSVFVGTQGTTTNPGNLTKVAGNVTVDGGADGADLTVDGSGAGVAANYTVTATDVTRSLPAGFGGVTYVNAASLLLTVGAGDNVVDVTSTIVPTTVKTNAGADTVLVAGPALAASLLVETGSEDDLVLVVGTPAAALLVDGGAGSDSLVGPDDATSYTVTGLNSGTAFGGTFNDVENIFAGAGDDTLNFVTGGSLDGSIDGGGGNDLLVGDDDGNLFSIFGADSGTLGGSLGGTFSSFESLTGGAGADIFAFDAGSSVSGAVDGAGGSDTIIAPVTDTVFNVTAANAGTAVGLAIFTNIENLTGGAGNDSFVFADGVGVAGTVDGGGGTDNLDYSAYTAGVRVNLGANAPGFTATLEGTQEVPSQTTTATGTASLTYNTATGTFDITVAVSNLDPATITGYHIHRAPFGANGPITVDLAALFGLGALVPDGAGGFTFAAAGVPLPLLSEAALLGGVTYLNFHTAAAPGGLVRGQLFPSAAFVNVPGQATGTGGVANIENATGGSAGDSLVGSNLANVLNGLGGNDTLVGTKGNDTVFGGAANDVMVWSNGDNTDQMDGDAGTDVVQVNGAVGAGDVFTVGPNGTRTAFARPNLVPFALDIGGVETLTVNGIGGDDQFTVSNLTGVADLTQVNLNGLSGNDTFNVAASPTVAVRVNGGSPVLPTLPGDTLLVDAENNTLSLDVPGPDASAGKALVPGQQPISFVSVETLDAKNVTATVVLSTNADDTVVLFKDAVFTKASGNAVYTVNGGPVLPVFGSQFRFDGLAGRDRLFVDYKGGDPLTGLTDVTGAVLFDGTNKADDTLVVDGQAKGFDAVYRPDAAVTGKGTVALTPSGGGAARVVSFQNLSPVDLTGLGTVTLALPNGDDTVNIAEGKDFGTNTIAALNLTGDSGGVAFEKLAAWDNGAVVVDTRDKAGTDKVTITGAANGHANAALSVITRNAIDGENDTVTVTGKVAVVANANFPAAPVGVTLQSRDITITADVSANDAVNLKGAIALDVGDATAGEFGTLTFGAVNVSAFESLTQTGNPLAASKVILDGAVVLAAAAGPLSLASPADAKVADSGSLTATGKTVTLANVGATARPSTLAVTATSGITLNGTTYSTDKGQTYTGDVTTTAATVDFQSKTAGVLFAGKLDAAVAAGTAAVVSTKTGTTFQGQVGRVFALNSLTVNGAATVEGGAVRTVGDQTYNGTVTVATKDVVFDTVVAADATKVGTGNVKFVDKLDGGFNVTVTTKGDTTFGAQVGVGAALKSLTTNGDPAFAGTTFINTDKVVTTGSQTFADDVVLGVNATFTSGGDVRFVSRLDAMVAGGQGATIESPFVTLFGGPVGTTKLASLTTNAGGTTRVGGGTDAKTGVPFKGDLTVATTGDQKYGDDLVLANPSTGVAVPLTTTFTAGGKITFEGKLDAADPLVQGALVSTAADTRFKGQVGASVPLYTLTTNGGGTTFFDTDLVRTTDDQRYDDAVVVAGAINFRSVDPAGKEPCGVGDITYNSTLTAGGVVTISTMGLTTFEGNVKSAGLVFDCAGQVDLNAKSIDTGAGPQSYAGDVILTEDTTLTAGTVLFGGRVDADAVDNWDLTINAGATTFNGKVGEGLGGRLPLGSLTISGTTAVNGGLVRTVGDQLYKGSVTAGKTAADTALFLSVTAKNGPAVGTGKVTFSSTLDGPAAVRVTTAGATTFTGTVGAVTKLAALDTDGGGTTAVNGGAVSTTGTQHFADAVTVGKATDFVAGTGKVLFDSTLTGPFAVQVNSPSDTVFGGNVDVGSLTTDAAGTTTVKAAEVKAAAAITFNDPVVLTAAATTFQGSAVTFSKTLTGAATDVTVNTTGGGVTTFGGNVTAKSLTTNADGSTKVNAASVATSGPQTYGDPVTVGKNVTFTGGGTITYQNDLSGPFDVAIDTTADAADTVFNGGVDVGSLFTNATGKTRVNGGSVKTARDQRFADPVTVGNKAATFQSTGAGAVVFAQTLDGPQAATVRTAGTAEFFGAVGKASQLDSLTLDAGTARVIGQYVNTKAGVTQQSGQLFADVLDLRGGGTTTIDQAKNKIAAFTAQLADGSVRLSTADGLRLTDAGVNLAGSGFVRIRTGSGFTAEESSKVAIPGGQFVVYPGLTSKATVRFFAPASAQQVVLGRPTSPPDDQPTVALPSEAGVPPFGDVNGLSDRFFVRAAVDSPVFVFGNAPRPPLAVGDNGDSLEPDFAGAAVTDFQNDGQDGFYDVAGRRRITFSSIEGLSGLSVSAFVAQTGEPGDATGALSQQYGIRVARTQNGTPLPGGLTGARLPENPFVVSPALVNPAAPTQSPRIAFGDFNADNITDLVLANGPGTPPLVTVIDGRALNAVGADLNRIEQIQQKGFLLAQFYAYDPGFQGGVNVAVGRLGTNGTPTITTGAESGGGPHIRTFELVPVTGQFAPLAPRQLSTSFGNFYAYEPSFTGGVRVAVSDVTGDGVDDMIMAPGAGGGPRVRVFDGKTTGAGTAELTGFTPAYADFFTVEPSFRGGLYIAAGFYRAQQEVGSKADIIVGAGGGGGPRVMIFNGSTLLPGTSAPQQLANFFAFTDRELNDPLFGGVNSNTGVGGVSFGGRQTNGFLDVLVSTARGPQLRVRRFAGGPTDATGALARADTVDLTDPALTTLNGLAFSFPFLVDAAGNKLDPRQLTYGATVGGFVV